PAPAHLEHAVARCGVRLDPRSQLLGLVELSSSDQAAGEPELDPHAGERLPHRGRLLVRPAQMRLGSVKVPGSERGPAAVPALFEVEERGPRLGDDLLESSPGALGRLPSVQERFHQGSIREDAGHHPAVTNTLEQIVASPDAVREPDQTVQTVLAEIDEVETLLAVSAGPAGMERGPLQNLLRLAGLG